MFFTFSGSRSTFLNLILVAVITIVCFTYLLFSDSLPWKRTDKHLQIDLEQTSPTPYELGVSGNQGMERMVSSRSLNTSSSTPALQPEAYKAKSFQLDTSSELPNQSHSMDQPLSPVPNNAGHTTKPAQGASDNQKNHDELHNEKDAGALPQSNPAQQGRKLVLLLAYHRSGSTFTASVLQQSNNTFYVFEPLHMLRELAKKSMPAVYINGTIRRLQNDSWSNIDVETMSHWINCGLGAIDKMSLRDMFHYHHSSALRPFSICLNRRMKLHQAVETVAIKSCLPLAKGRCMNSNLRLFKTIRLRMDVTARLMAIFPDMKVIHLVRDPRAMFNSQMNVRAFRQKEFALKVGELCSYFKSDLKVAKRFLLQKVPNYMLIRYEDIANSPFQATKLLYDFAGLQLTSSVMKYVNQSTSMNLNDTCAYCTRRANSSLTAAQWRNKVNLTFLRIVDNHCSDIYDMLGYVRINNMSTLRNLGIPILDKRSVTESLLHS